MEIAEKNISKKNKKPRYSSVNEQKTDKCNNKNSNFLKIICGLLSGAVNGFFGGGGGMIVVPALKKFCGYAEKAAHATAIAVILPITVFSGAVMAFGFGADFGTLIPVAAGSAAGGVAGALFIKKMPPKIIGYVFCGVMLIAGVRLTFF